MLPALATLSTAVETIEHEGFRWRIYVERPSALKAPWSGPRGWMVGAVLEPTDPFVDLHVKFSVQIRRGTKADARAKGTELLREQITQWGCDMLFLGNRIRAARKAQRLRGRTTSSGRRGAR